MGTPEFGVEILNALVKQHDVILVVTQPDKMVGRNHKIEASPVKKRALELGIEVFQPKNIKKEEQYILDKEVDLIVTAAYGQLIGIKVLNHPTYRSINVHASLLPKYRGASPIQRSIMNGDKETGITIMYMEKGMDSGDVLKQEKIAIDIMDTSETLFQKLAILGAKMICPTIEELKNGTISPIPQNPDEVSFAPLLTQEEEKIDFHQPAWKVHCQIRGLSKDPGAYFLLDGFHYKVYECLPTFLKTNIDAGKIVEINKKSFSISCGDHQAITLTEIKPEGRNLMKVSDFLNGKGKNILKIGKQVNEEL